MKTLYSSLFIFLITLTAIAQQNKFYSGDFWKSNPSLEEVQQLVKEGNDPVALNGNGFDATVYSIIRGANNDVINYFISLEGNMPNKKTHDGRNYLHWASYSNNLSIVKELLKKGSSVTKKDSHGLTPLAFAANAGVTNIELYKLFTDYDVDLLKEQSEHGASLLLLAAPSLQNEKELNDFLDLGFNLDSVDHDGNNIFHYAVKKGNISFLKLLIREGVDHKAINKNGGNAMLMASRGARGHQNTLELYTFLESQGVQVNVVGDKGRNPLHSIASNNNNLEAFDYFMNRDVDINLVDEEGNTPFMNSASNNSVEVVEYLFKNVHDKDLKNKKGQSALTMAVSKNSAAVVRFLLEQDASSSVIDQKGNNLAYYLVNSYNNRNAAQFDAKLELLNSYGVSMKATQQAGNTLYHTAVVKGNMKLLKQLGNYDINLNVKNNDGLTALHLAAMTAKDESIIKYLISKGADIKIKTDFEESVYDLATENELLNKNNISFNYLK
ncbi:ankyrin repeat domain-containing protein [Nonlabens mediterrranea]|uniref:Ankyrin repeat domain-containing protein n=1 Tax=Nonlabens mediterrranea TaxID=1419947 RepID=A0ABS0A0U6_9FLAO|nr:ankyrin repeat domain-containing protein [Nonlabens mediterrranea]